jgi:hypothetical protein
VRILSTRSFFEERLSFVDASAGTIVALRTLAEDEQLIRERLARMVGKGYEGGELDWSRILADVLAGAKELPSSDEEHARAEKAAALASAFASRLAVITGKAGTGKTTVARALLDGVREADGEGSLLLLAPTGKARIRLQESTKRVAKTIHQFLAEHDWIQFPTFALRRSGGKQAGATTVLVDEASMIPTDLLAALFRAIDFNMVRRLILMGDPNQLPPIGPGRPFADTIAWLDDDEQRRRRLIRLQHRGRFRDSRSLGLQLSDGYTTGDHPSGDDEVLARIARGDVAGTDVEVHFWSDADELNQLLDEGVNSAIPSTSTVGKARALDASFRDANDRLAPEAWQILSPLRRQRFGTDEINRRIQLLYRQETIESSKKRASLGKTKLARPAGDQQIVLGDKVIQMINERRDAWCEETKKNERRYVANGEVGLVTWSETTKDAEYLTVVFGTQPGYRFRYPRAQIDGRLELAYGITVHKSQGSDFDTVFLVIPAAARTLSRELVYTALTRFREKLVLLLERDISPLERFRRPDMSETLRRNTNLFALSVRPEDAASPYPQRLIHRTSAETLVRSKSELIVADVLTRLGLTYSYEQRLPSRTDPTDFRLPDFTVHYEGETFYWEHLGMLSTPSYRESWERKRRWYEANGYSSQLITSEDGLDGSIDASVIERTAREQILS